MYGIFTYIYPKNNPNVGKYSIHGASGIGYFQGPTVNLPEGIRTKMLGVHSPNNMRISPLNTERVSKNPLARPGHVFLTFPILVQDLASQNLVKKSI